MKRTCRRVQTPMKNESQKLLWLGATIAAPSAGMCSAPGHVHPEPEPEQRRHDARARARRAAARHPSRARAGAPPRCVTRRKLHGVSGGVQRGVPAAPHEHHRQDHRTCEEGRRRPHRRRLAARARAVARSARARRRRSSPTRRTGSRRRRGGRRPRAPHLSRDATLEFGLGRAPDGARPSLRRRTVGRAGMNDRSEHLAARRLPRGPARGRAAALRAALPPARHAAAGDAGHDHHRHPAGRGGDAARALRHPAPGRARCSALLGGVGAARADHLPADPAVRRPDEPVRRRRARRSSRTSRSVYADVTGQSAGRGRRPGPELRRALHRRSPSKLIGPITSIGLNVAGILGALVLILITAYYMAIRPEPLVDGLVRLVPPPRREHAALRARAASASRGSAGWRAWRSTCSSRS